MVLSFKSQFVGPILSGQKKHTLRLDPKRRWKKGKKIHFATGVRSSRYRQFHQDFCTGSQEVFMTYSHGDLIEISVDGRELFSFNERENFALNDGFDSWRDFFDWFYPLIKAEKDEVLIRQCIHWTDLRY